MEFTKGEWQLLIIEPDASRLVIRDDDGFICEVTQRDDGMSNAHLLKASPDMYQALEMILEIHSAFNTMLGLHQPDEEIVSMLDGELDEKCALIENILVKARGEL